MHLTIVGTGYVGLVTGTCFAEMGHKVYCVDIDENKINNLKKNIIPIYEPSLDELVADNQKKGNLIFTTDYNESLNDSEVVFIAVGTPTNEDGSVNLTYVNAVANTIGNLISHDMLIVIKSTVPVGTGYKIKEIIENKIKEREEDIKISIASNPEFLKEGTAVRDCLQPDRIVIGAEDEESFKIMKELYESFLLNHERYVLMDIKSSELTKYAANAMLASRISFMNEMSNICEATGANIQSIRQGIGSDQRIGYNFLYAGCGYGGSCFPKDVNGLINFSKEHGYEPKLLENVEKVNNAQKRVLVNKIVEKYGEDLSNLKIAIWGLSFKPGTDDIRKAPALTIIKELTRRGAKIQAYDPQGIKNTKEYFKDYELNKQITYLENRTDAVEDVDCLVLVTEWKEFRNIDFEVGKKLMKTPVVFDGRNIYNKEVLKRKGFELYQIGC